MKNRKSYFNKMMEVVGLPNKKSKHKLIGSNADTSPKGSTGRHPWIHFSKWFAARSMLYSGVRIIGKCFWIMSMNFFPNGFSGLATSGKQKGTPIPSITDFYFTL